MSDTCDCEQPSDCRRCPFAMQRIEQLEAELHKAQTEANCWKAIAGPSQDRIEQLETENAWLIAWQEYVRYNTKEAAYMADEADLSAFMPLPKGPSDE